tara:strand:- start:28625 stop:28759 length:135 start_codon:yes stop_codon:yes gene_type:complete
MWKFILLLILAGIVGGGVYLATWDMPPPSERLEKVIPNDRFNSN